MNRVRAVIQAALVAAALFGTFAVLGLGVRVFCFTSGLC